MADASKSRKKKKLNSFVIVTETNLANKNFQQCEFNPKTNEIYLLKSKCSHCDSHSSSTSESTGFDAEWLNANDKEALDNLVKEEPGHYRRTMKTKEEIEKRVYANKVNLLSGLRIQNTVRIIIDKRIREARNRGAISVNITAFILTDDNLFKPYDISQSSTYYEMVRNKHPVHHLDRCQLFIEMIQHQEQFKQLTHIFHYLEHSQREQIYETDLSCLIYKRRIEMVGSLFLENLDFWDRLETLFDSKTVGYYYAIIVCFDLFKAPNEI